MDIPVVENVLKLNDEIAAENRRRLGEAGVVCLNLVGSPGSGKTTLLEKTLDSLRGELRIGIITGDIATTRDAERLARFCDHVTQINTGGGCHLDANQVKQGMNNLPVEDLDLLIIENVGNLICPVGFDLGQDAKIGLFSVPEGEDKPAKHPRVVLESALLLLNKIDLLPHVPFSMDVFESDLRKLRDDVPVLKLSAVTGEGLDAWVDWVRQSSTTVKRDRAAATT
ncbi:MAG: hydrogenase nickel incorporation protein HypB [Phycisphaerales bacterium]|nr:MAG: hydrogenase nickel incorporation protein HypB [Phycisphaerales bacterium]